MRWLRPTFKALIVANNYVVRIVTMYVHVCSRKSSQLGNDIDDTNLY